MYIHTQLHIMNMSIENLTAQTSANLWHWKSDRPIYYGNTVYWLDIARCRFRCFLTWRFYAVAYCSPPLSAVSLLSELWEGKRRRWHNFIRLDGGVGYSISYRCRRRNNMSDSNSSKTFRDWNNRLQYSIVLDAFYLITAYDATSYFQSAEVRHLVKNATRSKYHGKAWLFIRLWSYNPTFSYSAPFLRITFIKYWLQAIVTKGRYRKIKT